MSEERITDVLIVGAGTMGRQIAATLALSGSARITLIDANEAQCADAEGWLDRFVDDEVARGRIRIESALAAGYPEVQLVIEAIREDEHAKRVLLGELLALAPRATIASNSSSLPIARLSDDPGSSERLVNLHFYVRPWERRVVELMTSGMTSPERLASIRSFMESLDFRVFTLGSPSFGLLYNRIWAAIKRESLAIVDEGVATAAEVDEICRALDPQPPRGPFERMDAVGLDTILLIEASYAAERGTEVSRTLTSLVESGALGTKSGNGFYDHERTSSERTSA